MSDIKPMRISLRIVGALVALLWAGALPAMAGLLIAEPGGPDQDLYNKGRSFVFEESWGEAREVFENLARRYPRSAFLDDALYWTAFALYQEGKPAQAYERLRSLVGDYPDTPWNVDARALMVRCAERALKAQAAGSSRNEYRRFLYESTRDQNAQVSLLAIDTLLNHEPKRAPELINKIGATEGSEGAVVLLDRFFGREHVKVAFEDASAGLAEGNVMVLVRDKDQGLSLSLPEALDAVEGRGPKHFSEDVREEMRASILEAQRSLVTQGPIAESPAPRNKERKATIVRVVDGEVHYYENGAETVKIVVLKKSAGYDAQNVMVFVDRAGAVKQVALADATSLSPGPTARGLSTDAREFVTQSLRVIELDLVGSGKR